MKDSCKVLYSREVWDVGRRNDACQVFSNSEVLDRDGGRIPALDNGIRVVYGMEEDEGYLPLV